MWACLFFVLAYRKQLIKWEHCRRFESCNADCQLWIK
uniref:Uncharacterized protein n=1 Tax=Siphoviridae sp. ctnFo11 TaxID=2826454 RepID=A0A8S5N5R7_9CAUD|nr:MAG TPA: hypothetical protein [Siphoviridae sp. ctnFo11]